MKKASLMNDYLARYAVPLTWSLYARRLDHIKQAVVIPAYAELDMLFATLASLADNPASSLEQTLVICVINNKDDAPEDVRDNNSKTIQALHALIDQRSLNSLDVNQGIRDLLHIIAASAIRLGYIDASSPGLAIPQKTGGVGMARKIGMDAALRVWRNADEEGGLMLSLDADTLVQSDYLPAVQSAFQHHKFSAGVIRYEHQMPPDRAGQAAISAYELFLRYWVMGLTYAGSPYAFHSIGSTIATTSDAYLTVRGMSRRDAGEDFYFLNKLAKIGPVQSILETVVYPSARISGRVPFGTGASVGKIVDRPDHKYGVYDPRVFRIVKLWLECLKESYERSVDQILESAKNIHPALEIFLTERKFVAVWPKIRGNVKDRKTYERQMHGWFDGFETLKLINYLTFGYYPRIALIPAVSEMAKWLNIDLPMDASGSPDSGPDALGCLLKYLRLRDAVIPWKTQAISS